MKSFAFFFDRSKGKAMELAKSLRLEAANTLDEALATYDMSTIADAIAFLLAFNLEVEQKGQVIQRLGRPASVTNRGSS